MKRTGPTNTDLQQTIAALRQYAWQHDAGIWKRVAADLEKPTRQRRLVNLFLINQHTAPEDRIIVPGKVLGIGELQHRVTIAAYAFSQGAREKIKNAQGTCLSISELLVKNPSGSGLKLFG